MANRWGNNGNSDRLYFGGAPKSLQMVTAAVKSKDTCSLGKKAMTILLLLLLLLLLSHFRQHIKKQRHYFANKVPSSQGYGFYTYIPSFLDFLPI